MPDGSDLPHEHPCFSVVVGFGEIGADPFFQVLGLPHIQNLSVGIKKLVHPGAVGQGFQLDFDGKWLHIRPFPAKIGLPGQSASGRGYIRKGRASPPLEFGAAARNLRPQAFLLSYGEAQP